MGKSKLMELLWGRGWIVLKLSRWQVNLNVMQWWETMGIEADAVVLQIKCPPSCEDGAALFRGWEGIIKQKE